MPSILPAGTGGQRSCASPVSRLQACKTGSSFLPKIRNGETPGLPGNLRRHRRRQHGRRRGPEHRPPRRKGRDPLPAAASGHARLRRRGADGPRGGRRTGGTRGPRKDRIRERPLPRHLAEDESGRRGRRPRPRRTGRGQILRGHRRPPFQGNGRRGRRGLVQSAGRGFIDPHAQPLHAGEQGWRAGDDLRRRCDKRHQERRPRRSLREAGRHGPRHALAGRPRRHPAETQCLHRRQRPVALHGNLHGRGDEGCATRTWLLTRKSTRTTSAIRPA